MENLAKSVEPKFFMNMAIPSKEYFVEQTKQKGDISEAKCLLEFQKRGIPVLIPWGDKERYDLVIELNGSFYRVQVKTANECRSGAVMCYTRSSHDHTTHKRYYKYQNQVDFFFFYNFQLDKCALVPMSVVGDKSSICLRVDAPKRNQTKNIKYFDDFSIDKTLCVETLHETSQVEEDKVQTTIGN